MPKIKIINDPVYGFIDIPTGLIMSLVDHPWFQRLRRIKQGGFSNLVYPGAVHTRLHHALGAYHLGTHAVSVLRKKGVPISDEEEEALQVALLLHDMGHGPFSHSLEGLLVPVDHEEITLLYLDQLNANYEGKLSLAIEMFTNKYHRGFFHQLISSELDLDRMDYLARDSFFTGVAEGVIGYDRMIHMLNVVENRLVVEQKGINSIEKFLLARKLMYAQVYHHKMVVASEEMLKLFFETIREALNEGDELPDVPLIEFIRKDYRISNKSLLGDFSALDDHDVVMLLKRLIISDNKVLSLVAEGLINRHLFGLVSGTKEQLSDIPESLRLYIDSLPKNVVRRGKISSKTYSFSNDEIEILMKNDRIETYGKIKGRTDRSNEIIHYICFPKIDQF